MITLQLAEMEVPFVLAVNMADEARDRGVMPRLDRLEERLGLPAVAAVAVRRKGLDRLIPMVAAAAPPAIRVDYGERIEAAIAAMERLLPAETPVGRRALAVMLLCGDDSLTPWLAENVRDEAVREIEGRSTTRGFLTGDRHECHRAEYDCQ